jgi:hypothetical protein
MPKAQTRPHLRKGFLFWWVIYSLLVYPASILCASMLISILQVVSGFSPLYGMLGMLGVVGIATVVGFCVGMLQQNLLQRYLYWNARYWIFSSMLGGFLGGIAIVIIMQIFNVNAPDSAFRFSPYLMPFFVFFVAIVQTTRLVNAVHYAWVWTLGNVVAGLVFAGLLMTGITTDPTSSTDDVVFPLLLLAPILQGFLTSNVLLFLFERYNRVVRQSDPKQKHNSSVLPKSIWDEAI